jgi:hypothetical protein
MTLNDQNSLTIIGGHHVTQSFNYNSSIHEKSSSIVPPYDVLAARDSQSKINAQGDVNLNSLEGGALQTSAVMQEDADGPKQPRKLDVRDLF